MTQPGKALTDRHAGAGGDPVLTSLDVPDPWARFGWLMAAVWLVFLYYPVRALLRSDADWGWIAVAWVAMAAFVVLYLAGFIHGLRGGGGLGQRPSRRQWVTFGALFVCALLTIPAAGDSALSFLPFIMSFASYGLTRLSHWLTFAAATGIVLAAILLLPNGGSNLSLLIIVLLLGVVNTLSTWAIMRSNAAEKVRNKLAQSEGREAVARDVHDLIGHSLTVVQLKAQLASRLIEVDPARAKAELADIAALTTEAIAGVRSTVAGVRAAPLADELRSCGDSLAAADVTLRVEGDANVLSPVQALVATWVLREATTNVLRHAAASSVTVRLAPGMLRIDDDGSGTQGREGNGIHGMRERATASGAVLSVGSRAAGGTRVEVTW